MFDPIPYMKAVSCIWISIPSDYLPLTINNSAERIHNGKYSNPGTSDLSKGSTLSG